jgi:hypothetical protein
MICGRAVRAISANAIAIVAFFLAFMPIFLTKLSNILRRRVSTASGSERPLAHATLATARGTDQTPNNMPPFASEMPRF